MEASRSIINTGKSRLPTWRERLLLDLGALRHTTSGARVLTVPTAEQQFELVRASRVEQ